MRLSRLLAFAGVAALVVFASLLPASAQVGIGGSPPSASIGGLVEVTPGTPVAVRGADWPVPGIVTVVLCGNGGRGGSTSCDLASSRSVGTKPSGEFLLTLSPGAPPSPCPCVLVVSSTATEDQVSIPVRVTGVEQRAASLADSPDSPATSLGVRILGSESSGGPTDWFGIAPEHVLVLEVENTGSAQSGRGIVKVLAGRGENPSHQVAAAEFDPLMPGEHTEVRVPFRLDTISFGDYTVVGQVDAVNAVGVLSTQVSVKPWGWIVVGFAAAVTVLVVVFALVRRRRHRPDPELLPAPLPLPPPPPLEDAVPVPLAKGPVPASTAEPALPKLVRSPAPPPMVLIGAPNVGEGIARGRFGAARRDRPVPVLARPHHHQRPVRRVAFPARPGNGNTSQGGGGSPPPFSLEGPVLAAPATPDRASADAELAPTTEDRS